MSQEGSAINGKELSYGAIVAPVFVNGVGQFGPTLDVTSTGTKIVSMTVSEPWVLVKMKNKVNKTIVIPIPCTSFTHTVLKE